MIVRVQSLSASGRDAAGDFEEHYWLNGSPTHPHPTPAGQSLGWRDLVRFQLS